MKKPTVMTVVGTRPEIIRLSRLIPKFDEKFNHVLIHTGQNFDPMLSDVFFEELRLRQPDQYLNVDHSSLGKTIGDLFIKFEAVLNKYKPDGVFILGDTNSALVAILAKRMQIPVYHWEAGNRSFDENVPEETNRKIVDHTAHFNIAYSYPAEANLIAEGLKQERVLMSGSPMKEVLDFYEKEIEDSLILSKLGLNAQGYFLASIHRQENVDNFVRMKQIFDSLKGLGKLYGVPVLMSTHPRTRSRMEMNNLSIEGEGLIFHKPFGFFDFIRLQKDSLCVISDSGTVSEEASILGFAAVTPRAKIERPEALTAKTIRTCGIFGAELEDSVDWAINSRSRKAPAEYLIDRPSEAVVELVSVTVKMFESWSGVIKL